MSKRTASTAHHRGILAGNPAKGLRGTLVEHRGIFSSVVNIYDDPSITQAEIELNRWTPTEILQDLSEAADKVLQSAGEDGYLKTLMKAKESTDSDAATNAVRQWHKKIITKRGALSCEGIAADFLFAKDQLSCREDFSSSQWDAVMTFALALHKFMLDHWGHHELIASAMETIQNLSSGSQARANRKTAKLKAILAICDTNIWNNRPGERNNAHWASQPARLKVINAQLSTLGYDISKSPAGMEKLIQAALKRAGRQPRKRENGDSLRRR